MNLHKIIKLTILSIILPVCLTSFGYSKIRSYAVGVDTAFPPFGMVKYGKVQGFDIDIIKAIAKNQRIKVLLKPMQFTGLIPSLQGGTISGALAGITIKSSRARVVDFSNAYYLSGLSILVKYNSTINSFKDLKGKRVATKKGTSSVSYLRQNHADARKILQFDTITDAYSTLISGGADAVIFDNPVNLNFIKVKSKSQYRIAGKLLTGEYYGIAISKKSPRFFKLVQKGLRNIQKDGTYYKIYRKYFGSHKSGMVVHEISAKQAMQITNK